MLAVLLFAGAAPVGCAAHARGNDDEAPKSKDFSEEERAEYNRLSERAQRLGEKTTWNGVERIFLQMEEAGFPLSQRDYLLGAEAARDRGDMKNVRDRLLQAMRLTPDLATGRSLAEIQGNYGAVVLVAKNSEETLRPSVRPFQPDRGKAIDFAASVLLEEGTFDGLIPVGTYTFGDRTFEVVAGTEPVEIDLNKK